MDGEILSVLDQCSIPNLKELLILNEQRNHLVEPEVESTDLGVTHLLRFVEHSECNVESFIYLRPMVLSKFKGLWQQWSSSLTKLGITVTSATRVDTVRELTFEEGKPGILPYLQHLELCTPEGMSIFQDGSLLEMALSRHTRCPGSFRTLVVETRMADEDILSQDIITEMKRLRGMRAVGVRVKLFLATDVYIAEHPCSDCFETDERFAKFLKERGGV